MYLRSNTTLENTLPSLEVQMYDFKVSTKINCLDPIYVKNHQNVILHLRVYTVNCRGEILSCTKSFSVI